MVLRKNDFVGSHILTNDQLNDLDTWHEKELDRLSGFNTGSNIYYRDANNYVISGATYDITNGSTYTFTYFRSNGYVISGTEVILSKTITNTYYRDGNNFVVSGLMEVS